MSRIVALGICVAMMTAGCALGPGATAPLATYDLGIEPPVSAKARVGTHVALEDVGASPWLQSAAILYRLTYLDAARLNPYSRSRWAAAPAALVGQRLRAVLAQANADGVRGTSAKDAWVLRVDLDAFEQLVDSPQRARAIVRMRASLHNGTDRRPRAQRVIAVEHASPSVDAEGAVRALAAATDASIGELLEWIERETGVSR